MTIEFLDWFDKTFPSHMWNDEVEREELKVYTWLAWRDALRCNNK